MVRKAKPMKSYNILITGGAGFIGSHLAEKLIASGARVTIADNLQRNSYANIQRIRKKVRLLRVDLTTLEGALRATKGQDVVFNLAAINTGIDFDIGRTQYMFEENMLLQMQPLRAAAINRVQQFVQVSSASIYSREAMEKRAPTKETDDGGQPEPSKLGYALAKRMGENLVNWYAQSGSMRIVISRFINVYGTHDHFDSLGHFIPTIIKKFCDAKTSVKIFGSGNQKRSFLHVDDAVEALLLLTQKGRSGEAYNVDPQDEHSVREIVETVRRLMNKNAIRVIYDAAQPEGSQRRMLSNTKIRSLGWKPNHVLSDELPYIIKDVQNRYETEKK